MGRLKLENGSVFLQDGYPVWVGDDDKEQAVDIGRLMRQNSELQAKVKTVSDGVRGFLLKNAFEKSAFLRDRSSIPADIARETFGKHFEIEESADGYNLFAKVDGKPFYSRQNPGQHADLDEALEALFERHSEKDKLIKNVESKAPESKQKPGGQVYALRDWQMTLSKAAPAERKELLRQAALGEIKVQT